MLGTGGPAQMATVFACTLCGMILWVQASRDPASFLPTETPPLKTIYGGNQETFASPKKNGLWSSPDTWSDGIAPKSQADVVIPKGFEVTMDTSPPPLSTLLLDGGHLIFQHGNGASDSKLSLQATHILVVNFGLMQAGSETQPFTRQLEITLLGNRSASKELPLFGAKVLGVTNGGQLRLFGAPTPTTWTRLSEHAAASQSVLKLDRAVTWPAGSEVVVASTDFDPHQAEIRRVASATTAPGGVTTLQLDNALAYDHYGRLQYFGKKTEAHPLGKTLDERAEVGLLSRNIKIQGDGSSLQEEYGCQVFLTGRDSAMQLHRVEVFNCGQRSSLARYPVHFHMRGNASESMVSKCAIHQNHNRAIAIHGVHYAKFLDNVIYNTKGHAVFVEDAIEMNNVIHRNLVVLTRKTTSLLQTDSLPAAFWITNAYNDIQGNVAAGSERYGFWFQTPTKVTGPSVGDAMASEVCPIHRPLLRFADNTAHSCFKNGLHIYDRWYPVLDGWGGYCSLWKAKGIRIHIERYTGYKCRGSAYNTHESTVLTCKGCTLADSFYLWKHKTGRYGGETGNELSHSLLVGFSDNVGNPTAEHCLETKSCCVEEGGRARTLPVHPTYRPRFAGLELPRQGFMGIANTTFANFRPLTCALNHKLTPYMSKYMNYIATSAIINDNSWYSVIPCTISGSEFVDSNDVYFQRGSHDGARNSVLRLLDGLASVNATNGESLVASPLGELLAKHPKAPCKPTLWNTYLCRTRLTPFRALGVHDLLRHKKGGQYAGAITVVQRFQQGEAVVAHVRGAYSYNVNLRVNDPVPFELRFGAHTPLELVLSPELRTGEVLLVSIQYDVVLETITINGPAEVSQSSTPPTLQSSPGTWHYHELTRTLVFSLPRRWGAYDVKATPKMLPTPNVNSTLDCHITDPDYVWLVWTQSITWSYEGMIPHGRLPKDGDDVTIGCGFGVVLRSSPPSLGHLTVRGTLKVADESDISLSVKTIAIMGGRLGIGSASKPFEHRCTITLLGTRNDVIPFFGARLIVVAQGGQLEVHGHVDGRSWGRLDQDTDAVAGDTRVTVDTLSASTESEFVQSWAGHWVVLAPSGKNFEEAEAVLVMEDEAVDPLNDLRRAMRLKSPLKNGHRAVRIASASYDDRAEVGLLSRNIVIRAENDIAYDKTNNGAESFAFGCAVWAKDYSLFRLHGVELAGCGQKHVRAAVTVAKSGHLQVPPDGRPPAYMRHCSVHHSSDHGVEVRGARLEGNSRNPLPVFELSNNVIFESARAGVAVPGGAVNVHNNLAVNSGLSSLVISRLYVFNKHDSAAFQIQSLVASVQGNVAAGGTGSGFLFAFGILSDFKVKSGGLTIEQIKEVDIAIGQGGRGPIKNNVAHSHRDGLRFIGWEGNRSVHATVSGLKVHWVRRFGVQIHLSSAELELKDSVIAEAGTEAFRATVYFPTKNLSVWDCVFVGRASKTDAKVAVGASVPQFLGGSQTINGVLLPRTYNTCPCNLNQPNPHISSSSFTGCRFEGYDTNRLSAAFASNAKGNNAQTVFTRNITFNRARPILMSEPDCATKDKGDTSVMSLSYPSGCDSATQAVLTDLDGSLTGTARPSVVLANNPALASMHSQLGSEDTCEARSDWNSYVCPLRRSGNFLSTFWMESLDADAFDRYMGPIWLTLVTGKDPPVQANAVYGKQDDSGMHMSVGSVFTGTLVSGGTYNVKFGATVPQHLLFSFRGQIPGEEHPWVVLALKHTRPGKLQVYEDGKEITAQQNCDTGLLHVNVSGHKLVEVVSSARKKEACFCCEPALVVLFSAMLKLEADIEQAGKPDTIKRRSFVRSFQGDMSSALDVPPENIVITDIRAGSILVDFEVVYPEEDIRSVDGATNQKNTNSKSQGNETKPIMFSALQDILVTRFVNQVENKSSILHRGAVTRSALSADIVTTTDSTTTTIFATSTSTPVTPASQASTSATPKPSRASSSATESREVNVDWTRTQGTTTIASHKSMKKQTQENDMSVVYTAVGVSCGIVVVVAVAATLALCLLKPKKKVHSEQSNGKKRPLQSIE